MLAWIFPKGPGSHPVTGGTIINKEIAYHIARFPDGTIRWAFRNEDPGWRWADTGYIATEGEWTHLAVVYEDGTVSTYAGGSLVHQYEGVGSFQQFLGSSLGDFRIGCRQGSSQNFHGLIDEVEVHDRAFPVEDVGRHMAVRQERQGLLTVEFPGDIFVGDSVGADTKRTPKTLNGCVFAPGTDCTDADLVAVDLRQRDLSGPELADAVLAGAILRQAYLPGGDLRRADLSGADLLDAGLLGVDLSDANLADADLTGAVLIDADLRNADFSRAVLSFANLTGAILRGADFTEANLRDVDFSHANVFGGLDASGATLCRTTMPDGTLRDAHCGPTDAPSDTGGAPLGGSEPHGITAGASDLPIGEAVKFVGITPDASNLPFGSGP